MVFRFRPGFSTQLPDPGIPQILQRPAKTLCHPLLHPANASRGGRPILPVFKLKDFSKSERETILSDGYPKRLDGEAFGFF